MARQITFLSFNQLVGEVTRLIAEGRRAGDRFAMESHNPGKGRPEIFYKRSTGCNLRNLTRPIHGKGMGIFSAKKNDAAVITLLIQMTVVFTFVSSMLITVEHESVAYYSTLKMILIIKQDKITLLLHAIGISNMHRVCRR